MALKTVASFREPYKAHMAKGRLQAEGIPAVVVDEHLVQINWTYSQAIGGVKVQVPEEAAEQACEILRNDYVEELSNVVEGRFEPASEDICPKCNSLSISSNPYSIWSLIPSLFFLLPLFFRRKRWVCDDCGARW